MQAPHTPLLITFDGEARSGKGTIVNRTQSKLQDSGFTVLTIDRGQLFRGIAAMAHQKNVDCSSPKAVEAFLQQKNVIEDVLDLLRTVPSLSDDERDALLYTAQIGEDSANIGACPLSQSLAIELLENRVARAKKDRVDVVLVDGRALETLAINIEKTGHARYLLGLYFICNARVGAQRTLSLYDRTYQNLSPQEQTLVDDLVSQIKKRNESDRQRPVEPLVRPEITATTLPDPLRANQRIHLIDTSAKVSKDQMAQPVVQYILDTINAVA